MGNVKKLKEYVKIVSKGVKPTDDDILTAKYLMRYFKGGKIGKREIKEARELMEYDKLQLKEGAYWYEELVDDGVVDNENKIEIFWHREGKFYTTGNEY